MATEREIQYDRDVVPAAQRINGVVTHPTAQLLNMIHGGTIMQNIDATRGAVLAQLSTLAGAVNALAKGEVYDPAKMIAGIAKAIDESMAKQGESIRAQIAQAIEAADIDGQVKAGLLTAVKGITQTETTTFELKEK